MTVPDHGRPRGLVHRPRQARHLARLVSVGGGLAVVVLVLFAPAAGADSGRPTNYRSVIDTVTPHPAGVSVDVVANDAFIQVAADKGHTVDIPGYDGEPYLRIKADGTVQENLRSPARFLNQTLTGKGALPVGADSKAAPEWSDTGDRGSVAWHDHRIHWMLDQPPTVADGATVQNWVFKLHVDGRPVTVDGHLAYHADVLPWAVVVAVGAAAGTWWVLRRSGGRHPLIAPAALAGVSIIGLVLSWSESDIAPISAAPSRLPLLLCAVSLVAALAAAVWTRFRSTLLLGSVALLAGWLVVRIAVFWKPLLPTGLPYWVDRAGTGLVVGVAIGAAVSLVTTGMPTSGRHRGATAVAHRGVALPRALIGTPEPPSSVRDATHQLFERGLAHPADPPQSVELGVDLRMAPTARPHQFGREVGVGVARRPLLLAQRHPSPLRRRTVPTGDRLHGRRPRRQRRWEEDRSTPSSSTERDIVDRRRTRRASSATSAAPPASSERHRADDREQADLIVVVHQDRVHVRPGAVSGVARRHPSASAGCGGAARPGRWHDDAAGDHRERRSRRVWRGCPRVQRTRRPTAWRKNSSVVVVVANTPMRRRGTSTPSDTMRTATIHGSCRPGERGDPGEASGSSEVATTGRDAVAAGQQSRRCRGRGPGPWR